MYVIVKHTIQDYNRWKPIFDEDGKNRKAYGCKGAQLFQDAGKPNDITVILEFASKEQAQKMFESKELRETMQKGGVISAPEISFLTGGERQPN